MMYEPDPEDQLWTLTQNYMHAPVEWKPYDLSGVHHDVPTARSLEISLPGVCTAIEEMMKKLPVKDRWQRNRTLIEAARTMLADAKLPVTFWAKAVNTACYIQNRVLVNKSQNKTLYELLNDRTPAIGFLKPFSCYVMILNTLDNLGKFEAKGDEGYFIGYSMSSKAFRVFNKRTRRVEENLHVEFLENKAIEKGAGPNWLFDIDSLTKSMNYVPVDAGTNSTNFLGTNDAANQEVKKDVSSLRYIALPNLVHDALLESSSSKPQDESSTKVPEGSGNPNPTTSTSNPSADQIETLTVESPIPTVSSPVPTACLNDSPEPSSEARLISKKVTNQEETPSLDYILSLTNRFEDILRVESSSDEAIGVKADVLKNKKDERGIVIRNKAKLVAQGHTQEEGIDYDEMDVKGAFLYGTIDKEVYVLQPLGFQDPEFPAKVYKVEKAMYGLHQAPRAWYGDILKKFGYSDIKSSNTPMDKENPWGKDGTGKDVDLHLY
nr:putative ribonuclease H-like domain-containing protein [Tanacetum cinerariifolium]